MLKNLNYEKIYFWVIALFVLTLPLSRAAVSFFSILLPLIWIIEGDFKRKFEIIKDTPTLKVFLLFIIFSLLSLIWTENISDAKRSIRLFSYFFAMYVIATSFKAYYTRKIIDFFLIGMFISEIIAYGIFFGFWSIKGVFPNNPSPFMHHIDYSIFLAFTSILLLYRIFSKTYSIKEKMIFSFFFLTVTGNLFLTFGRTGQVAFIAALFIMLILHFRFTIKAFLIGIITLTLILTTAYNTSHTFEKRIHQGISDIQKLEQHNFSSSWGIRAAFYISTFNILKEHPIIGVGLGDFKQETAKEINKPQYSYLTKYTKKFMSTNTPHNQYLLILLQTGIVGLFFFLLYIYYFIKLPIFDKEIKDLSLLFITIFLVGCMTNTVLTVQFTLVLFSVFSGIFISNQQTEEQL